MVFYGIGFKGQLDFYTDWALILVLANSGLMANGLSTWLSWPSGYRINSPSLSVWTHSII
jgi:hypothetical protein